MKTLSCWVDFFEANVACLPLYGNFLFVFFVVFQHVAEHMHILWWKGEVAEELAETGAYLVLEWLTRKVAKQYKEGEIRG